MGPLIVPAHSTKRGRLSVRNGTAQGRAPNTVEGNGIVLVPTDGMKALWLTRTGAN
jgi:hypothetical protein